MKIIMGGAVAVVAVAMSVAGCSGNKSATSSSSSSVEASSSAASSAPPATSPKSGYAKESYDLGHSVVYREAFQRFTGTGTALNDACSKVADEWQSLVGKESWWNRDDVMRGCVDRGAGPGVIPAAKECPAKDGKTVKIWSGDVTCDEAYFITGKYNFDTGGKYQKIDSADTAWTCYTTLADQRPVILVCGSDNKDAEFDVSSPS